MPHANIWIRKSNSAAWEALEDKSDFVNTMLEESKGIISTGNKIKTQVEDKGLTYVGEGGGTVTVKDKFGSAQQLPVRNGKVMFS